MFKHGWNGVTGVALRMVSAVSSVVLTASVAMAQATPTYTVDFTQAQLDVTTVLVGLIAFTLVIFGGRKVLSLIRR